MSPGDPAPRAELPAELPARLRRAAREAGEVEACGLWWGRRRSWGWSLWGALEAPNLAPDPRRRFRVDPEVQLRAERRAEEHGALILGSWHSHPGGGARPSALDLAGAAPGELLGLLLPGASGRVELLLWEVLRGGCRPVSWTRRGGAGQGFQRSGLPLKTLHGR